MGEGGESACAGGVVRHPSAIDLITASSSSPGPIRSFGAPVYKASSSNRMIMSGGTNQTANSQKGTVFIPVSDHGKAELPMTF